MDHFTKDNVYMPYEEARTPRTGKMCLCDHFWLAHPEHGIAFYKTILRSSFILIPQINTNKEAILHMMERCAKNNPYTLKCIYLETAFIHTDRMTQDQIDEFYITDAQILQLNENKPANEENS